MIKCLSCQKNSNGKWMQLPSQIGWRFYSRRIAKNVQYCLKICFLNWFPSQLSVFLKNKKKNQTGEIKWLQYSSRFYFACNFILWDYVICIGYNAVAHQKRFYWYLLERKILNVRKSKFKNIYLVINVRAMCKLQESRREGWTDTAIMLCKHNKSL